MFVLQLDRLPRPPSAAGLGCLSRFRSRWHVFHAAHSVCSVRECIVASADRCREGSSVLAGEGHSTMQIGKNLRDYLRQEWLRKVRTTTCAPPLVLRLTVTCRLCCA